MNKESWNSVIIGSEVLSEEIKPVVRQQLRFEAAESEVNYMSRFAETDITNENNTNTVIFELKDDVLVVCNNGESFSIEGVESLMLPYYTSKSEREAKQSFKSSIINDQIKELLEKRQSLYKDYPERIQSDYSTEYKTVGEYHGREILELLQNCIDAMPGESTFQIGAKGLGFRSLLNWCEKIKVFSGELSIAFGLEEAAKFKELLGLKQKVAILSAPTIIEPIESSYTTQIVLNLKKSVIDDVKCQLMQIDERSMVFLPKIEELIIRTTDSERSYHKLEDTNGDVLVSATVDGVCTEYLWRVFKQERKTVSFNDIDNEEKEYNYGISIAFCDDLETLDSNYLYSYFKTKVEFPLGWLCHADFELRSDRNDIIDHPLNKLILQELVSLIDASSEKITDNIKNPENSLNSLVPTGSFSAEIAGFRFSEYYYANIGKKRILPTTNGDFISLNESPWLSSVDFPTLFTGDAFKKLLKFFNDKETIDFIKKIAARDKIEINISIQEIQCSINKVSIDWSPEECFVVFEWWRTAYGYKMNALDYLPNLIRLENGNWATGSDRVYFKVGGVPLVPTWVRFSFLRADFQEAAIKFYNNEDGYLAQKSQRTEQRDERNIPDYAIIGNTTFFRYLDRSTTIAQVNISVGDSWDYSQGFALWLYENYGNNADWTPPTEVGFNFPSQNKTVTRPEMLYFGEYYNNELSEILAMQDGQEELFNFSISLEEKERFTHFISKFGVCFTPIRAQASFSGWQIPRNYKEALYSHFSYPLQLDVGTVIATESLMRTAGELVELNVDSYRNLEDVLSKAKTSDLLLWIAKDDFLKKSLMSKYETSIPYPLSARRQGQRRPGQPVHRNQVRNYIAHTFTVSKWIQLGDKRYSPNQIILDEKIGMQLEPRLIGKKIELIFDGFSAEEYEINAIIGNLGFINDFSKIESFVLYAILNELSNDEIDINGELSKKIYFQIMKATGLKDPNTDCQERIKFLKDGKVYCFNGKFHKVQTVRYADKSFPERVRANHCLINLPKNRGAKKAELWFGTKEFQPDVTVCNFEESVYNQQFQKDFHELLKGLFVENCQVITDEKRWRSVKSMRIVLASSIILIFGETEQHCEAYQYAKDNAGQYVLMIGNERPDQFDERLTSVLFEIVRTAINIDDTALGSSFRDLWKFPSGTLRKALVQRNEDENIWKEADFFFDGTTKSVCNDDIVSRNKAMFIKCRNDNFEKFKRILYTKLLAATTDEQKLYLTEIEKYNRIEPDQDSMQTDYCNVLLLLQSIAPANSLLEDDNETDVDAIGKETKRKFHELFPNCADELNKFLIKEYDSLLRFGNYDFLKAEFEKYLEKRKGTEEEPPSGAPKPPVFVDSSNLHLSPVIPNPHKRDGLNNNGTAYIDYSSRQIQNTYTGKLAERIVYDYLVGLYGEKKVKWVSQFAREENVNLDGSDSTGYDIEYFHGDEKFYVEVKTNSGSLPNITFNLTICERIFADKHSNYQVYVVTAPKSEDPIIIPFSWCDIQSFANTPTGYLVVFKQQDRQTLGTL